MPGGGIDQLRVAAEVDDTPPMVGEHDQDEQHAPPSGRDREEIDRDQVAGVA
jgi:hypothetical protein